MTHLDIKLAKRRDRRKAKLSGYRRPGRSNPKKVGHGGSGQKAQVGGNLQTYNPKCRPQKKIKYKPTVESEYITDSINAGSKLNILEAENLNGTEWFKKQGRYDSGEK